MAQARLALPWSGLPRTALQPALPSSPHCHPASPGTVTVSRLANPLPLSHELACECRALQMWNMAAAPYGTAESRVTFVVDAPCGKRGKGEG